ncbi:unnamed protein product [Chilo suppressalis]|uniref:Uncharacterized protein n=1 Tax=Chilo suppressalis TaxID=168631 RepID=A0ABN8B6S5_CHISP|nr:unnamed protein product [Chilo suppressalis]
MSLVVKLNRFKVLKCKNEKYARLEFRGLSYLSDALPELTTNNLFITLKNQLGMAKTLII